MRVNITLSVERSENVCPKGGKKTRFNLTSVAQYEILVRPKADK